MRLVRHQLWALAALLLIAPLFTGCNSSSASGGITLAIDGPQGPLDVNGERQFTATVTGTTNTAVLWSVVGGDANGTFSGSTPGLYTAPAVAGVYTIAAASVADPSVVVLLQVTVVGDGPTITFNHDTAIIDPGQQRIFIATLTGVENPNVTWSADGGDLNVLDGVSVIYTAPVTPGTYQVTATSVGLPSLSGSITITVPEAPVPTETIFNNGNIGGVDSGPTNPTVFTIATPRHITYVSNYHYFNGGALPGTIAFEHEDGTIYGPWQTTGFPGQGGVTNAYWVCYPEVEIKAGTYTVIDSDPSTWSHNWESDNRGFTHVMARVLPE